MNRILFLTNSLSCDNGWGRFASELLSRMPAMGVEPVVGAQGAVDPRYVAAAALCIDGLRSGSDGRWQRLKIAHDVFRLRSRLVGIQAVHCLTEPFIPLGHEISRRLAVPLYATFHGTYAVSATGSRSRAVYGAGLESAAAFMSVSRYTRERIITQRPELAEKIFVVTLGVEDPSPHVTPPQADERERAFITVGHIKPRKGLDLIIRAMPQVIARKSGAILYVAGSESSPRYVMQIRELADSLGVGGNIRWLGRVDEATLTSHLRRVRGLILPSQNVGDHFEGFGLVHLEANVNGTPTVGSLECGNEDAIEEGRSGFLIPQGDIELLSQRMIQLLGPEAEWNAISYSAREHARRITWHRTVRRYVDIYDAYLKSPSSRGCSA